MFVLTTSKSIRACVVLMTGQRLRRPLDIAKTLEHGNLLQGLSVDRSSIIDTYSQLYSYIKQAWITPGIEISGGLPVFYQCLYTHLRSLT